MRPVSFQRKYITHPAGSCLACYGQTKVICTATIERDLPPFLKGKGQGWLTADHRYFLVDDELDEEIQELEDLIAAIAQRFDGIGLAVARLPRA